MKNNNDFPLSAVQSFINKYMNRISTLNVSNGVVTIKFNKASIDNSVDGLHSLIDDLKPSVKSVVRLQDEDDNFNVKITP